jgi:hypothetical protein
MSAGMSAVPSALPPPTAPDPEAQWANEPPRERSPDGSTESAVVAKLGLDAKSVLDVECRTSVCRIDAIVPSVGRDPDPQFSDQQRVPDDPNADRDITTLFYVLERTH